LININIALFNRSGFSFERMKPDVFPSSKKNINIALFNRSGFSFERVKPDVFPSSKKNINIAKFFYKPI
jgi:hypothetical protein